MRQEATSPLPTARIGARSLSEREIQDTLPTYSKLKEQIEQIRASYNPNKSEKANFHQEQTTNNISILGPRGSGKTSVLKTLYKDLEDNNANKQNILLPPIVPENMEKHLNFMSCLLGLLKAKVDEVDKTSSQSSQCPPKKSRLAAEYDKLLKTYLYLQEPYQEISVTQYSTQAEYTRTMQATFEANNNFIHQFKEFIDNLVQAYGDKALLFVFIDDIDLSAYRCADLVKTLLSYLAHPAIVTVLAGDINIFGEALTLNFLRQEDALDGTIQSQSYLIEQGFSSAHAQNLLDRKKQLAYDYLKKVIPPTYRHFVNLWSLSQRGSFCPSGLLNSNLHISSNSAPTLEKQLHELGRKAPQLQGYFDAETPDKRPIALYHLFDDTARGLVNAYVAIQQFCFGEEEANLFPEKVLMEALVASNYQLNRYHDLLFHSWIHFGTDASTTEIKFDLFNVWLEATAPAHSNDDKDSVSDRSDSIALDQFRLFTYLDWSARLLGMNQVLSCDTYMNAKRKALLLLCCHGKITDQQGVLNETDSQKLMEEASTLPDTLSHAVSAAAHTLFHLPYPLAIRYADVSFLSGNSLYVCSEKDSVSQNSLIDTATILIHFMDLLTSYYSKDKKKIGDCLIQCPAMISLFDNLSQRSQHNFVLASILNDYVRKAALNKNSLYSFYSGEKMDSDENCTESLYSSLRTKWLTTKTNHDSKFMIKYINNYFGFSSCSDLSYFSTLFNKHFDQLTSGENRSWAAIPFYNYLTNHFLSKISTKSKHFERIIPINSREMEITHQILLAEHSSSTYLENKKIFYNRLKILQAIDETGCWAISTGEETPIHIIQKYVFRQLQNADISLCKHFLDPCPKIDISCSFDAFKSFEESYKGRSNTVAKQCCTLLSPLYHQPDSSHDTCQNSNKTLVTVNEYVYMYLVLNRLVSSSYVRYGRNEAREVLRVLGNAVMFPTYSPSKALEHEQEIYLFWFHCYCRYRIAVMSENPYAIIEKIFSYQELLDSAMQAQDNEIQANYLMNLSEKSKLSPEQIKSIPELFS